MKYTTIRIEGPILSADILDTLEQGESGGQSPKDFGLDSRAKVKEEIVRAWADARDLWQVFRHRMERVKEGETGASETRRFFMIPFLGLLGYEAEAGRAETVNGKSYAISHRAQNRDGFPIHIMGFNDSLDRKRESGGPRMSPHALVQEYLNLTEHLYALVTNGLQLRLLRGTSRLVRLSFVEFDLERMFDEDQYADFAVLYRLLHVSRMPARRDAASECIIERYHQDALEAGSRIRDGLSDAVRRSIITLADGFLANPRNDALRAALAGGELTAERLYHRLLQLIYRFLFLMVMEERGLIFIPGTPREKRDIYARYYGMDRLRALSEKPFLHDARYDDLWRGLARTFALFEEGGKGEPLGIRPLAGELFHYRSLGALTESALDNATLLACVRDLNVFVSRTTGQTTRVNYGSLSVEEFGSVYEGMLDYHAVVIRAAGKTRFELVSGKERKTTGSYYTPPELVAELIKSALEPVVKERMAEASARAGAHGERGKMPPSPPSPLSHGERGSEYGLAEQAILSIKVCDPACGSGHFLLAAARYLARELATARAGGDEPSPEELRRAQREVIGRCIYGVDKNPLAVELCKVALWMEGHEPGKPLSFLDHRIKCGDSLVGVMDIEAIANTGIPDEAFKPVTGDDREIAKELKKRNHSHGYTGQGNLFGGGPADSATLAKEAAAIAAMCDDSVESVKAKAARYSKLHSAEGLYSREFTLCSLWTAAFFIPMTQENKRNRLLVTSDEFFRYLQGEELPKNLTAYVQAMAIDLRFFHWPIEFPEVFASPPGPASTGSARRLSHGERGSDYGFDCVLGNPPWERIKLQEKEFFETKDHDIATAANKAEREKLIQKLKKSKPSLMIEFEAAKHYAEAQSRFLRESERYPLTATGDINTYVVFAETARSLISKDGMAGIIVPTGIATDDTCKEFFGDLIVKKNLAALYDFENREALFADVHRSYKFSLFTISGKEEARGSFAFFLTRPAQLNDRERVFALTPEDIALINPNTRTCPVFRTRTDAELTKKIYQRVPVLVNETTGENPWGVSFMTMFHMSNDSGLFHTEPSPTRLPLYEAKLFHQYDHRWATYDENGETRDVTDEEKADMTFEVRPRYWVEKGEVERKLEGWGKRWLLCFRDVTNATNERTFLASVVPIAGIGHTAPLLFIGNYSVIFQIMLFANVNSIILDYNTRIKIGGTHLTFFLIKQLPIIAPATYQKENFMYISSRILELVYTAHDIKPFADDVWNEADEPLRKLILERYEEAVRTSPPGPLSRGERGSSVNGPEGLSIGALSDPERARRSRGEVGIPIPPFPWNPERRAVVRAELDAYYAKLYGLSYDELRYILDPADVYGEDFPGETFRVLKNNEIKKYGEYRTKRLVLEAWERV